MNKVIRVNILCEGQTEETFIKEILTPYFTEIGIYLTAIVLRTGPASKGGISSYSQVKTQILKKCKEDTASYVTTMIDMYALPDSFPCVTGDYPDAYQHADAICNAMEKDISMRNFIPNIIVHEFETILFSSPQAFDEWFNHKCSKYLNEILQEHNGNPELINNGKATAPSKRILDICRQYDKILHGTVIAIDIGLAEIRKKCKRFDLWLCELESLSNK